MAESSRAASEQILSAGRTPKRVRFASSRVIEGFVLLELVCQLALLSRTFAPYRVIFRTAPFAGSLFLWAALPNRNTVHQHPSSSAAAICIAILLLSIVHPETNGLLPGVAQIAFYGAIFAPIFWVPRLSIGERELRRFIIIIWLFHTVSSAVGILQVYKPDLFQMSISTIVAGRKGYISTLFFRNAFGVMVLRPSGLTDSPGGVAMSGLYTDLFGIALLLTAPSYWWIAVCISTGVLGTAALYLSHVRSLFVCFGVCAVVFAATVGVRSLTPGPMDWAVKRLLRARLTVLVPAMLSMAVLGGSLAFGLGGQDVRSRVASLTAKPASEVFYDSRGKFLQFTIETLLPQYPVGAGLGRWGMMRVYFGDESNLDSPPLYSEIQWSAWLLDGGVPLIIAYVFAIGAAMRFAWRNAFRSGNVRLAVWSALIFAYSVGALADTFAGHFFMSQLGLDFWMVHAALFATATSSLTRAPTLKAVSPLRALAHRA